MTTPKPALAAVLAQLAQLLTDDTPAPLPEPRPMPERVLLTVEEAAERLQIGRTVAWRLVSTGELQSVQIGRLRRVPAAAVAEYAAQLIAQQARRTSA
ncbi:helix-turn-helix domain-containing protein [Actinophytocola xanthii]|uniref:DNA-binding protein n=1 Tax=Actinophytocola xanthii TaxID=1912961 RepID=A0A1Q8CSR4_9PSEU|nr:helix-turn-helix domain-containing protein [Actinophytocola xanthii]OLF17402.1 DNA-binding protein [Actinophytocola xanthii]